jgi:hypothetical protein
MARLRVSWLAGGAGQLDAGNHGAGISDQLPIDGKLNIGVTVGLGGGSEDNRSPCCRMRTVPTPSKPHMFSAQPEVK